MHAPGLRREVQVSADPHNDMARQRQPQSLHLQLRRLRVDLRVSSAGIE